MPLLESLSTWVLLRCIYFSLTIAPAATKDVLVSGYTPNFIVYRQSFISFLLSLKYSSHFRFNQLVEIAATDFPGKEARFLISYCLLNVNLNSRVWVSTFVNEKEPMPSVSPLFSSALWLEREVYDLMGIFFTNHPDLRRILTDYGFRGAPLRKDFPLFGFTELSFNNKSTRVRVKRQQEDQGIRFQPHEEKWSSESRVAAALLLLDSKKRSTAPKQ